MTDVSGNLGHKRKNNDELKSSKKKSSSAASSHSNSDVLSSEESDEEEETVGKDAAEKDPHKGGTILSESLELDGNNSSNQNVTIVTAVQVVALDNQSLPNNDIIRFLEYLKKSTDTKDISIRKGLIAESLRWRIANQIRSAFGHLHKVEVPYYGQKKEPVIYGYELLPFEEFDYVVRRSFKTAHNIASFISFEDQLSQLRLTFSLQDDNLREFQGKLGELLQDNGFGIRNPIGNQQRIIDILCKVCIGTNTIFKDKIQQQFAARCADTGKNLSWEDVIEHLSYIASDLKSLVRHLSVYSLTGIVKETWNKQAVQEGGQSSSKAMTPFRSGDSAKGVEDKPKPTYLKKLSTIPKLCYNCGRPITKEHIPCLLWKHPDHNHNKEISWLDSPAGKKWHNKDSNITVLPEYKTLTGEAFKKPTREEQKKDMKGKRKPNVDLKENNSVHNVFTLQKINSNLFNANIQINNNILLSIDYLLDTGALQGNYLAKRIFDSLEKDQRQIRKSEVRVVGINDAIRTDSCGCIEVSVFLKNNKVNFPGGKIFNTKNNDFHEQNFENKILNENLICKMNCEIIPMKYDMIIGIQEIQKHKYFSNQVNTMLSEINDDDNEEMNVLDNNENNTKEKYPRPAFVYTLTNVLDDSQSEKDIQRDQQYSKDRIRGLHQKDYQNEEIFTSSILEKKDINIMSDVIQVIDVRIQAIIPMLERYEHVFSKELKKEPAKVQPMKLQVSNSQWENKKHRQAAYIKSAFKNDQEAMHIEKMLAAGIIEKSRASYWSQCLIEPKKTPGQTRFVVDYRGLNECTNSESWPIPNVKQMFLMIGNTNPKYFAVFDMTSGYFQVALDERSRESTAFTSRMGLYQWTRVPMGLKGAPSYFQQIMCTEVLNGHIHNICECYMDDVIVYGSTEEAFMRNVESVLIRFSENNITINPKKCIIGATEIEYVGHIINQQGITFDRDRIMKAIDIEKPKYQKQLKSFLGVINYFRSHVKDMSAIIKPLHSLLQGYDKRAIKKVEWGDEDSRENNAFKHVKEALLNIPTLFFMNENSPIYLETDACDYGIGGYLYQVVDEIQKPIAFMSQALDARQANWHTNEKECFAIYRALQEFEYLIRDVYFILRTDHANLTYLSNNKLASKKVLGWKILIQEFNFKMEFIQGEKNIVADRFSRCVNPNEEKIFLIEDFAIPTDNFNLIGKVHNSIVGHAGVEKTISRLDTQGHKWLYRREHVKRYISKCACCQMMSYIKNPIHIHPFTLACYEPFERMAWDTIVGLPEDKKGNACIMVGIDLFSRFIVLYPTRTTSAEAFADVILDHIGTFGVPSQILTDNGVEYCNKIIAKLAELIDVQHIKTLPSSKEENGICERANREVMDFLRDIIFEKQIKDSWSDALPLIQRSYNASKHSSIGVSPAALIFGNAITLDRNVLIPSSSSGEQVDGSAWLSKLINIQKVIMDKARDFQKRKDQKHIQSKPVKDGDQTGYSEGEYVLLEQDPHEKMTNKKKLDPNKKGPYIVVHYDAQKDAYAIRDLIFNKLKVVKAARLSKYLHSSDTDVRQIVNQQLNYFDIEAIVDHKGNIKNRNDMKFLIKWEGYEDSENTWESYQNLYNNKIFHAYLEKNRMKSIIPAKYKYD